MPGLTKQSDDESNGSTVQSPTTEPKKRVLRIAVLECDTLIGDTKNEYDGYGNLFQEYFKDSARKFKGLGCKVELDVVKCDVTHLQKGDFPDFRAQGKEKLDGLVVSGSRYDHDDYTIQWIIELTEYLEELIAYQKERLAEGKDAPKLLGTCFGHQIVARALGAKTGENPNGWDYSVTGTTLTELGKEVFDGRSKLNLHHMNESAVHDCPPGAAVVGTDSAGSVQGLLVHDSILTFQGHPEFDENVTHDLLGMQQKHKTFDEDQFEDGMRRADQKHDGQLVGKAFVKFLLDGKPAV